MGNGSNRNIPTILLGVIMFGCTQQPVKQIRDKSDSSAVILSNDTTLSTPVPDVAHKQDFDLETFVNLTNSLLTKITDRTVNLTYTVDTLTNDVQDDHRLLSSLLQSSGNYIIKIYLFDPGRRDIALGFRLISATYADSVAANVVFSLLKEDAYDSERGDNLTPGLTYSNDFVIRSGNQIYWLNSGCQYAFFNHQKLKDCMMQSLHIGSVQDSIWCKCGQVKCSL